MKEIGRKERDVEGDTHMFTDVHKDTHTLGLTFIYHVNVEIASFIIRIDVIRKAFVD